ncbi:MAG: IS982 family transposase [Okeania sp. SIO3B3]|nr:IS982 family transposase [Okeania sp. SIO3B3]
MLSIEKITEIFCHLDDFSQKFMIWFKKRLSENENVDNFSWESCSLCMSEVMCILILFHLSSYRNLKAFYTEYVCVHLSKEFPSLPSYNRFVELEKEVLLPLFGFLTLHGRGKCSGISFVDSTSLKVCHNKRIPAHKVFDGIAKRGKNSMGWFFGFKLHLLINEKGEIISLALTQANVDDRNDKVMDHLMKGVFGKVFGDKGYIKKELFERLWKKGIQLITRLKKNMKNHLIPLMDKILLRKRAIIETVNDLLKNVCQIEHSRHRSPVNFLVNLIAALIGYNFLPKKPSLRWNKKEKKILDSLMLTM